MRWDDVRGWVMNTEGGYYFDSDVFIVGGSTSGSYCKKDPAPRLLNDVHLLTLSATAQS